VRQGMAIRFVCTVAADRFRAYIGRVNPSRHADPDPILRSSEPAHGGSCASGGRAQVRADDAYRRPRPIRPSSTEPNGTRSAPP
jgi:hypothetical protein